MSRRKRNEKQRSTNTHTYNPFDTQTPPAFQPICPTCGLGDFDRKQRKLRKHRSLRPDGEGGKSLRIYKQERKNSQGHYKWYSPTQTYEKCPDPFHQRHTPTRTPPKPDIPKKPVDINHQYDKMRTHKERQGKDRR